MTNITCCSSKKRNKDKVSLGDINIDMLRLSSEEKTYYKNLFLNLSENEHVSRELFPELIGVIGTNISAKFAQRIFDVFAKDKDFMRLDEYLKYVDLYHHGKEREKCFFTFQLMDESNDRKVDYKEFKNYMENIIVAVNKVHPTSEDELLSEKELRILFDKISNKKDYFVYKEFEDLYKQKPMLLSWIDYFKNNDSEFLIQIDKNMKMLMGLIERFNLNMKNVFERILQLNGVSYDFQPVIDEINKFCSVIEDKKHKFISKTSAFNLKSIFDNIDQVGEYNKIIKKKEFYQTESYSGNHENIRDANSEENNNLIKNLKDKILKENPLEKHYKPNSDESFRYINQIESKVINTNRENNFDIIGKSHINKHEKIDAQYDEQNRPMNNDQCETIKRFPKIKNQENTEEIDNIRIDIVCNDKKFIEKENVFTNSEIFSNYESVKHSIQFSDNYNNEIMKNNEDINNLITSQIHLFRTNTFIIKWLSSSYKWIEGHFLKNSLKREKKKAILLNTRVNKPIEEKLKKKFKKSKDNTLKMSSNNFEFLLNMMIGIQMTVNSTSNINLTPQSDVFPYLKSYKYSLPLVNFISNLYDGIFSISSYASVIFQNIRISLGIDKDTYIQSISPQDFITEMMISSSTIIEELFSTSKSGSLFYHTRDGKYILKTISDSEYRCIKKILPSYFKHILTYKDTLLPKFYSCHKLIKKVGNKKFKFNFVIMDNIFSTSLEIHLKYDLKGSKIGKEVLNKLSEEERAHDKFPFALKDLDLDKQNKKFVDKEEKIINQLKIDTEFLKQNKIIDYSLLIGIHRVDKTKQIIQEMKSNARNTKADRRIESDKNINNLNNILTTNQIANHEQIAKNKSLDDVDLQIEKSCQAMEDRLYLKEYSISTKDFDYSINEKDLKTHLKRIHSIQDLPDGGILSTTGTEIYYIGIIDVLIKFDSFKKMEYIGKLLFNCSNKISVAPSKSYRERFIKYMSTIFVNK